MASIREVAKLANVSPATVSRVMNGTANVDTEKKERVLRAISETGFIPNEVARSLFKKSAKIIGLVLPSIENPFFTQMASAVEKEADANGYRVLLYNTGNDFEKEKSAIQMLLSMNADGIILTRSDERLKPYVESCTVPIVITDTLFSGGEADAYVYSDHYQGGRLAAQHLIDCGCRKLVCIRGLQGIVSARARYEGFRAVCNEHGIEARYVDCDYTFAKGLEASEYMLEKYPDVDGVVACNDMVAISAFKVLHRKGIQVPEQVQLIGFDDIDLASLMSPGLTTIAQPIKEIGRQAAELIIKNEEHNLGEKRYILPVSLVERETTKKRKQS